MSPALAELIIFATSQIRAWVSTIESAKDNPNMTEAEKDKMIAEVQERARKTVEAWDSRNAP